MGDTDQLGALIVQKVDSVADDIKVLRKEVEDIRVELARNDADREKLAELRLRADATERAITELRVTIAKWSGAAVAVSAVLSTAIKYLAP